MHLWRKHVIFNLFWRTFEGVIPLQKIQVQKKLIIVGVNPFLISPKVKKSPDSARGGRGGVHLHFGPSPKFPPFFDWKATLTSRLFVQNINNFVPPRSARYVGQSILSKSWGAIVFSLILTGRSWYSVLRCNFQLCLQQVNKFALVA